MNESSSSNNEPGNGMQQHKCGLFALLPKPVNLPEKSSGSGMHQRQQSTTLIVEEVSKNKSQNAAAPCILVNRPLLGIVYDSDSDEEEEERRSEEVAAVEEVQIPEQVPVDFFGLTDTISSPTTKRPKLADKIAVNQEPAIFFDEQAPGPARPVKPIIQSQEPMQSEAANSSNGRPIRAISNQEASQMIYQRELAPYGVSTAIAEEAVSGIIDVSVDAALGPNVHQNLLKNLSNKQMAQVAIGPLPKVLKNEADKLAKRKHQITHLAQVAVSREEELQEKWSESKLNKKMSRQKYGF